MTTTAENPARRTLTTPLQYLKGVGPDRAKLFARLGLSTVADLLFFFPRDYHDLSNLRDIADLAEGVQVSVRGVVEEVDARTTGAGGTMLGVLVRQGGDFLRALWFNQPFMREKFQYGQHVLLFGQPRKRGGRWEMAHPRVEWLTDEHDTPQQAFQPVYPLTEGLSQHHIRRAMETALAEYVDLLGEVFPPPLLEHHRLLPLREALPAIHFPAGAEALEQARRRFVFQELFILELALAMRRHVQQALVAPALPATARIDARIRRLLPFRLTEDQERAVGDITADMARRQPMNRLLQGEVGSGKTIVAVYAVMTCVAHGHQAAIMAPTEVLARQHFETLGRILAGSQGRMGLLVGGLTATQRSETLTAISGGAVDLVVGTQAIIRSGVEFAKLGLVVIDEQQKFGVRQRAALKQSGEAPHYLVMTATPIPRTVTLTLFGDLDVSTIRECPPGRQPVQTYLIDPSGEARWWDFVRQKLTEGRQAFIVTPLVEESEHYDLRSVTGAYEQLANGELADFRLGLIHGRLSAAEKQAVMQAFRDGRTQALVCTSVIEVGIDVPNATVMTINSAERFGLAQLHQLRGRVSRGTQPGYCGVLSGVIGDESRQRLEALAATTDGFELAEIDFKLRGPGDILGTKQHGLPPMRIADVSRDGELLAEARRAAAELMNEDAGLKREEHARLRRMALRRYGESMDLGDVG